MEIFLNYIYVLQLQVVLLIINVSHFLKTPNSWNVYLANAFASELFINYNIPVDTIFRDGFQGNATAEDKCRCDSPNILAWNNSIPSCNAPEPDGEIYNITFLIYIFTCANLQ
jgi:hypothetical protein